MFSSIIPEYGSNYKAGQIFFTRIFDSFISNGITWVTGDENELKEKISDVSHCGICTGENQGYEMTGSGFQPCSLDKYFNNPKCLIIFREPVLLECRGEQELFEELKQLLLKDYKYDYRLIVGFFLTRNPLADKIFPKSFKNYLLSKFDKEEFYVCSEIMHLLYYMAHYHGDSNHKVSPQELFFQDWLKPLKKSIPSNESAMKFLEVNSDL